MKRTSNPPLSIWSRVAKCPADLGDGGYFSRRLLTLSFNFLPAKCVVFSGTGQAELNSLYMHATAFMRNDILHLSTTPKILSKKLIQQHVIEGVQTISNLV